MSKHHPGKLCAEILLRYYFLTPKVDLIMCRRQPGIGMSLYFMSMCMYIETGGEIVAIGRLCEKCDGKWYVAKQILLHKKKQLFIILFFLLSSPVCDSYVRPETLVRICDECNFGTYGGRCIICGAPGKSLHTFYSQPWKKYVLIKC